MTAMIHTGDALTVLRTLPDASARCCVTSPPYWGLRDYGMPGQLGLESTPEGYVARMVEVFREVRRVLTDDGTLWLNLGDSYAASGSRSNNNGTGASTLKADGRDEASRLRSLALEKAAGMTLPAVKHGMKPKDLVGIPWMVAFALRANGWYLRSDIIWAKPNPMPESVTDRPTKSHEYLFLLSKQERYYYDAAAIAEPVSEFLSTTGEPVPRRKYGGVMPSEAAGGKYLNFEDGAQTGRPSKPDNGTRNARSVWTIATMPYKGAHFATFPEELARRCIMAGSSSRVCEHCNAPWTRESEMVKSWREDAYDDQGRQAYRAGSGNQTVRPSNGGMSRSEYRTTGYVQSCSCEESTGSKSDTVIDPFGGSGTVGQVATGNARDAILIELNPEYVHLMRQRIGPMFCGAA